MLRRFPLFTFLLTSLVACLPLHGADLLIDTHFDQTDSKGGLSVISPREIGPSTLPVNRPTRVNTRAASFISVGGATALTFPHALFSLGATDNKPDQVSKVEMQWDLRGLRLKSGRYLLSADITPLTSNLAGFNIRINFAGEDGVWLWPYKPPLLVAYDSEGVIRTETGQTGTSYAVGKTTTLTIAVDLDAQSWTASVDGIPMMPPTAFDIFTPETGMMIGGVFIRGLENADQQFAVSNLKLECLDGHSPLPPARIAANQLPRIACVGDSITQGYGLGNPDKNSYPGVMRELLKGKALIGNFGISGTTMLKNGDSPYWRQWSLDQAKAFAPDIVVIKLGTNDSKPSNFEHADEIAADTAALVQEFNTLPSHPKVYVVMPVPVFKSAFGITEELLAQLRPLIAAGAKQAGATVIDSGPTFAGHAQWFRDGVHPKEEGAAALAGLVADNLPVATK